MSWYGLVETETAQSGSVVLQGSSLLWTCRGRSCSFSCMSDPGSLAHTAAIACYTLRRFGSLFTYNLFVDRVKANGRQTLGTDIDVTLMLRTLSPEFSRVRVRRIWLIAGVLIAMLFWGGMIYAIAGVGVRIWARPFWILGLIGLGGALMAIGDRRKKEYAIIRSDAGVPVLSILLSSPREAREFESFIDALRKQIGLAKEMPS